MTEIFDYWYEEPSSLKKFKRPLDVPGTTIRYGLGCGHLYVSVGGLEPNKPIEVFARLGKSGGCASCQGEALTRVISVSLRYGVPPEEFIDQLRNLKCPSLSIEAESCPDAISKALAQFLGFTETEKETK